ncbi:hypothetical protein MY092_004702 [Salmonella enterica]|uniref:Uncharacterized protein n=1 Tax=Salmonella enterica subsp. enterica serovar Panama TaxID=29472 RepID=A0A5U8J8P6_SALET|nr:hypothetical protein [Salmonella enterica]EBR7994415.1 hypothetical protein [Salmonella enterica subsp. enterica serovar Panama]ASD86812.1 hypothetical protein LFZ16_11405 [Salmonella enterica subsp. enterica serovar India str. SA20085604]EBR8432881.1 hypothetical protein [Salmonella enterica subsp. enterica serovar Panama]EBW9459712.1 hypothetical protein [Salmonella enterica subsp. enterica serovar Panama]EJC4647265.1 hypothetical protein [Salmonella enterica]
MRKYTAYRPGEERFDGQLYRTMVRAERRARENPRVNMPPSPPPVPEVQEVKPETPPVICPARQVMNIYRELEAEKERAKWERKRQILAHKARLASKYLDNKKINQNG